MARRRRYQLMFKRRERARLKREAEAYNKAAGEDHKGKEKDENDT